MALRERENEIWNILEDGTDTNLQIVAARILMATDGVEVKPLDSSYPDRDVVIYANRGVWNTLDLLKIKNEFNVLQEAVRGGVLKTMLSIPTSWEPDTKRQVKALYWQKFANRLDSLKKLHYSIASSANKGNYYLEHMEQVELLDSQILGAREKAKILLGELKPLETTDVYSLVNEMISQVKLKLIHH